METQVGKMRSPEAHLFFFQPLTRGHYNPCHILLKASIIYMDTHNCHYSNDKNACNFYPPDKDLWLLEKAGSKAWLQWRAKCPHKAPSSGRRFPLLHPLFSLLTGGRANGEGKPGPQEVDTGHLEQLTFASRPAEEDPGGRQKEKRGRGGKGEGRKEGQDGVGDRRGDCTP